MEKINKFNIIYIYRFNNGYICTHNICSSSFIKKNVNPQNKPIRRFVPIYKFEVSKQYHRHKLYCQQFGFIFDNFSFLTKRCASHVVLAYRQLRRP